MDVDEDAGNCDGSRGDGEVGRVLCPVKGIRRRSHGDLSGLWIVEIVIGLSG
jgi:hypothetical protein